MATPPDSRWRQLHAAALPGQRRRGCCRRDGSRGENVGRALRLARQLVFDTACGMRRPPVGEMIRGDTS